MSKIKIKNFGPIREGYVEGDGFMDIRKVTFFIGDQGSGKSTVAKLISTFMWMEKALNRGDFKIEKAKDVLHRIYWHNLEDYFKENTEIEYIGNKYCINYWAKKDKQFSVDLTTGSFLVREHYVVPKIIYIPAERNFLSTIKEVFDISGLPDPLADFSLEFRKAQYALNGLTLPLPINNAIYEFNKQGVSYISGEDYKLNLLKASSGYQSLIPMFLVSRYLAMKIEFDNVPEMAELSSNNRIKREEEISAIWSDKSKPDATKKFEIDLIYAKYHNKCLINIVEEPEQNLFPSSQRAVLNDLLKFNNMLPGNKLIVTTHSPYLINYLTLSVKADVVEGTDISDESRKKLEAIVPQKSTVAANDLVIYELDQKSGTIVRLKDYKGLPSDENYLNDRLEETNEHFAQLQEIEKGWR